MSPPATVSAALPDRPAAAAYPVAPDLTAASLPAASPDAIRARLAGRLGQYSCGTLDILVDDERRVHLQGSLDARLGASELALLVADADGMALNDATLRLTPGVCHALRLVRSAAAAQQALHLALNQPDGIYHEGDLAAVRVQVPEEVSEGFLYVAFVDPAGEVVHLFPNRGRADAAVRGGEVLQLGAADEAAATAGTPSYRVVPPFGQGLVVAILSRGLLPALVAREVQSLERYLDVLERTLAIARRAGPVSVATAPLETRPR